MLKSIGIGKKLMIFITVLSVIMIGTGAFSYLVNRQAVSDLKSHSEEGLTSLGLQTSLVKTMALVHGNILPIMAETDKDSRDIRVEIAKGFMTEFAKNLQKCGEPCAKVNEDYKKYEAGWNKIAAESLAQGNLAAVGTAVVGNLNPIAEGIFDKLDKLAGEVTKHSTEDFAAAAQSAERKNQMSLISTVLTVLVTIFAGFFFQRAIVLAMSEVVHKVKDSVQLTTAKTEAITNSSQTLSNSSIKQAGAVEETVASITELSSMVQLNADNARSAADLAKESTNQARTGGDEIGNLIEAMKDISTSSKKIEEITSVIDDIAFQTNLLALNAAVEAARAGEQGKGFAVVADAVRTLAQKSADAAKEIGGLIQDTVSKTVQGTKRADSSSAALKKIIDSIDKVSQLNDEIAHASQEQASGIAQLSKTMSEIDQTTQTNAQVAQILSSDSDELKSQSIVLDGASIELEVMLKGKSVA